MMTRLTLPRQITYIFALAFVPAAVLMVVLIVGNLRGIYQNAIYDSLEAEGKAVRMVLDPSEFQSADNMAYIRYSTETGTYNASGNLEDYVHSDAMPLLLGKALAQQDATGRYVNRIGGKIIYYVVLNYRGFFGVQQNDILIILTDTALMRQMMQATSLQMILACLVAFIVGYLIIFLWTRLLVRDIRGIRNGVIGMGENHYKTRMRTARRDELGDLVNQIEGMRRRIIENERTKQQIIQGVSHDLKTPIGVIQSYAVAVKDDMCDAREAADIILRQTRRLTDKVTKLLHLTRLGYLDAGRVKMESVPMNDLIAELAPAYAYQTQIAIEQDLTPVCFSGDAESWRIAVENILDNAIRYAKSRIVITLRENRLSIYNDGREIPEDDLEGIFNAYEKSRDGKFGLGLSIVRQTVALFGYRAEAHNTGDGVRFTISRSEGPPPTS